MYIDHIFYARLFQDYSTGFVVVTDKEKILRETEEFPMHQPVGHVQYY